MKRADRILTVAVLILAQLTCVRAEPSDEEKRQLATVDSAFHEGAFDLAIDRAAALLRKFPKTDLAADAQILQAQALYQLGRSDAALAALTLAPEQVPEPRRAEYLFWQGESLLDLGRFADAEQKYRALLGLDDRADRQDAASLGLAWAEEKEGREKDALPLLQSLIKQKGSSAQRAQLLLAEIDLADKQYKDALTSLQALLASAPDKATTFETNYWLGETYMATAQPDQAAAAYQRVTGDPQAFPRHLVALAWLGLGRAQRALQQDDQAMLAYEQTYRLSENPDTQLDAFRAYLECARASNQLPEAISKLQEFAKTSDPAAPAALLAIGSALAETRDDDRAIGMLESLLVTNPTSPLIPAANEQLGQLYERSGRTAQAIKAFNACIGAGGDPAMLRTAHEQLGYVLLKQSHDYAGAAAQFATVADGTDSSAERDSYNFLLAQAGLGKVDVFQRAEADFIKRFPKSSYLKSIALAEGRLLAAAGKTDDAKAVYQKAIASGGHTPDQEALLNALADLQYQTNDLEGTLATCQTIVDQFPDDALAAAQRGVLVSYELKKLTEDQVEQALAQLANKYKNVPGAPEAYFRVGEFYFYREDYARAQDAFQQLTDNYPNSPDAVNAYFFAGRAAFAHQDYTAARTLLEKVPDNSPLKPDARLWEGRVCQQQNLFDQAAAFYDAVLTTEKSGPRFVDASLLKGQCLFAQNPPNYAGSLAAFDQVLKGKDGTVADRNEAAVRGAKCLEKMGRVDEAMGRYLDVLYGKVAGDDASVPAPPEFSWQIKAGWEAGRIRETQRDWRGAIEIYKRLEQIGGAHAQDFHDLVNKLRRDNYIYE